jgi:hypothetical protein
MLQESWRIEEIVASLERITERHTDESHEKIQKFVVRVALKAQGSHNYYF